MRKYLYMLMCVLAACSFHFANAQTFNGPSLYDVSGKVKSIKVSPSPLFAFDKVEFMKDGHIIDSSLTFDWDGKAIGKDINVYKMHQAVNLEYDDSDRLINAVVDSSAGLPGGYKVSMNYEGDHPLKMIITETKGKNPCQYTYLYSNYSFDDNGNWITRDVDLSIVEVKSNTVKKNENFTETRQILYYE